MLNKNESVRIEVEVVSDRRGTLEFKEISTGGKLFWDYTSRPKIGEFEAGLITTIKAIRKYGNGLSRVKRVYKR